MNFIIDDVLYYQRPLKSKKGTIGGCQYESRSYKVVDDKTGELNTIVTPVRAIAKSHPLFQEYRLWQFINDLKIIGVRDRLHKEENDFVLTSELRTSLYDHLSTIQEFEEKDVLQFFKKKGLLPKAKRGEDYPYEWNYQANKKYPSLSTAASIRKRFSKMTSIDTESITDDVLGALYKILYSVTDKNEYSQALITFANKYGFNQEEVRTAFEKFPPFESAYASVSKKAIKKMLPLMRSGHHWVANVISDDLMVRVDKILDGEEVKEISDKNRERLASLQARTDFQGLPMWLAATVVYGSHSVSGDIERWISLQDVDRWLAEYKQHSLRNPIVEQVILETVRVVRDIWAHYGEGKESFFDEIHVELGREMKRNADQRKRITERVQQNQNRNERIRAVLTDLKSAGVDTRPESPSHQEILKIYEAGVYDAAVAKGDDLKDIDKIRNNNKPSGGEIKKYRLWLEQSYISPYTGAVIPLSKLFSSEYDIEHIIPRSRYFDDSLGNKVICERAVNELKGNATAMEFILKYGGSQVELGTGGSVRVMEQDYYEQHVDTFFSGNRKKHELMLSVDPPEGFISRQLNDTRYITKYVNTILSNVVRTPEEKGARSAALVPVTGALTSTLKREWGLDKVWAQLMAPRFIRMNEITQSEDYGQWVERDGQRFFRWDVPDKVRKGFSIKRIDHRHHALDAIVCALASRQHVQYVQLFHRNKSGELKDEKASNERAAFYKLRPKLQKMERRSVNGQVREVANGWLLPWTSFPDDVRKVLGDVVVSFKQNLRVINKTTNKYWKYVETEDGWKKQRVRQKKGDSWAIRKPLHKETVYGKINIADVPKGKIATAARVDITSISSKKHIDKITDSGIQKVLRAHAARYLDDKGNIDYKAAFTAEGVQRMNDDISTLNGGKQRMPIYKARMYEVGSRFAVGDTGNKVDKYVEAEKGTNLFFAVYWDKEKQKRQYKTIPLNEVIEYQKQLADEGSQGLVPVDKSTGELLFVLSPGDLVVLPGYSDAMTQGRPPIYKCVSSTGRQCHFVPQYSAAPIADKVEYQKLNKLGRAIEGPMITSECIPFFVDRLGLS